MVQRRRVILASLVAPCVVRANMADAAAILRRARERYARLKTYQDHGNVRFTLLGSVNEVTFETAFVRPDMFRFEWSKGHPFPPLRHFVTRSAIWSNADGAFTWTRYPGRDATMRKDASLAMSVAGATGVSSGAAHTAATLLMPDLWREEPFGKSVLDLESAQWAGADAADGVAVHRILGQRRGGPVELWIGKEDGLLRRVVMEVGGTVHTESRDRILVDADVPASRFASPPTGR